MNNSIFDLFQLIASNAWLYGGTFLIVLSILVFVHEWGHYIVARLCGVRVETFSIGFGREIFGITDSHGTRWKFSLIPLGGYVKMFGDTDPASASHTDQVADGETGHARPLTAAERGEAFFAKPVAQRAAIVFAGPGINFLFAIIIMTILFATVGQPVSPPVAAAVIGGSSAEEAGFKPHDEILAINGAPITRFDDIRREVTVGLDSRMVFTVRRDGQEMEIAATPRKMEAEDHFGFKHSRGMLGLIGPSQGVQISHIKTIDGQTVETVEQGREMLLARMGSTFVVEMAQGEGSDRLTIAPTAALNPGLNDPASPEYGVLMLSPVAPETYVKYGPFASVGAALKETWFVTTSTLEALGQMITGTRSAGELGGIIRIGAIAGDMAQAGLIALISFTALLSINLGLINLFPVPMLDGGHLVFYAVEAVKGSPLSERVQEYAFRLGLAFLIGIMLFANLNDIVQLVL